MVATLLYWIYISLICLIWGDIFINGLLSRIVPIPKEILFSITCLTGLCVTGIIALYFSLFLPLDWRAHCSLILPVLLYCIPAGNRYRLKSRIISLFRGFSVTGYFFLAACILMVLIISSERIIHPDTLAYHAQSILWFEKYKVVPGLVHLRLELGFQSLWFATLAIFNPPGSRIGFFPLGGCILCWYFIFIVNQIDKTFLHPSSRQSDKGNFKWEWLFLLCYTLFSWTQVRLTAASASPDFIVTLLLLASVYIFIQTGGQDENKKFYYLLASLFSCVAFVTKLSAISICLLPMLIVLGLCYQRNFKTAIVIMLIAILTVVPLLIRNFIATGYPIYPSSFPDLVNPDWKLKIEDLHKLQEYITAYARYPVSFEDAGNNIRLPFKEWTPIWWENLARADKVLLTIIIALAILNIFYPGSWIKKKLNKVYSVILFVVLSGSVFWFLKAPDPRFGTGFLISLLYMFYLPFSAKLNILVQKIGPVIYRCFLGLIGFIIIAYTIYRLDKFFNSAEIWYPPGISQVNYMEIDCQTIKIRFVSDSAGCGLTPVPCVTNKYLDFIPRGAAVSDGFKAR